MKRKWIYWWIANAFWLLLFLVGNIVVWTREVDGAGVTQTVELRLIAFLVLIVGFMIPILIQMIWLLINLKKR